MYIIEDDGINLDGSGPANYSVMQGTSMACQVAAGAGALVLSAHPEYSPAQVKYVLQHTAIDKGSPGFDNVYGAGLINASRAVTYKMPPQRVRVET